MAYYALLLFFVAEYVRPGNYLPGLDVLHLNTLIPVAALVATFVARTPVSTRQFLAEANTRAMGVLLSLLLISTFFATVTYYAFEVTKTVFAYLLIYTVIVRQLGDVDRVKGVFKALVLVHLVVIALSPDMFTDTSARTSVTAGAFLGDGNDFSLSVNICLPLCLFLLLESRKKVPTIFWTAVVLVLVMSVVATKSRGGTLALIAVGLYFWFKSRRKLQTTAVLATAVVIVLLAAPPEYFERMDTMTDTEESSAEGRIVAWKASYGMALSNPLLGVGAGHFPVSHGGLTAHSVYFLLLGELGFPGLAVLLFLIFSNLAANSRLQREIKRLDPPRASSAANLLSCTSASLVGFAVAGAFLSVAYYPHLYVVSGLLAAARHVVRLQLTAVAGPDLQQAPDAGPALAAVPVRHQTISPDWRPNSATGTREVRRHSA